MELTIHPTPSPAKLRHSATATQSFRKIPPSLNRVAQKSTSPQRPEGLTYGRIPWAAIYFGSQSQLQLPVLYTPPATDDTAEPQTPSQALTAETETWQAQNWEPVFKGANPVKETQLATMFPPIMAHAKGIVFVVPNDWVSQTAYQLARPYIEGLTGLRTTALRPESLTPNQQPQQRAEQQSAQRATEFYGVTTPDAHEYFGQYAPNIQHIMLAPTGTEEELQAFYQTLGQDSPELVSSMIVFTPKARSAFQETNPLVRTMIQHAVEMRTRSNPSNQYVADSRVYQTLPVATLNPPTGSRLTNAFLLATRLIQWAAVQAMLLKRFDPTTVEHSPQQIDAELVQMPQRLKTLFGDPSFDEQFAHLSDALKDVQQVKIIAPPSHQEIARLGEHLLNQALQNREPTQKATTQPRTGYIYWVPYEYHAQQTMLAPSDGLMPQHLSAEGETPQDSEAPRLLLINHALGNPEDSEFQVNPHTWTAGDATEAVFPGNTQDKRLRALLGAGRDSLDLLGEPHTGHVTEQTGDSSSAVSEYQLAFNFPSKPEETPQTAARPLPTALPAGMQQDIQALNKMPAFQNHGQTLTFAMGHTPLSEDFLTTAVFFALAEKLQRP